MAAAPHPLRDYRTKLGKSLDWLADELQKRGYPASKASLSRVENNLQTLNPELIPQLKELVGLPPEEARPDLARFMRSEPAE